MHKTANLSTHLSIVLKIYDFFRSRQVLCLVLCVVLTMLFAAGAFTLRYEEDITAFLPLDKEYKESMEVWQYLSEASRIVIIFEQCDTISDPNPDRLCDAVDAFAESISASSELSEDCFTSEVDLAAYMERLRFVP